ncbi:MAG: YvcK family protein [Anaerolineales bacterium]|nr:YvcK family protein [Anaerolineales bacterium]
MPSFLRWLQPGLYLKRWVLLFLLSILVFSTGLAQFINLVVSVDKHPNRLVYGIAALVVGITLFAVALRNVPATWFTALNSPRSLGEWVTQQHLKQGIRVVAIGGGTGLPSALRAMKRQTSNITAVVAMADDGGSSGRLRRDLGVPPPGDLRSNIVALARDEDLMTQLFNFRFESGELDGHSFGNLFLAALMGMQGGIDEAALVAGKILAIQGHVLPCTLANVHLVAHIRHPQTGETQTIEGESNIPQLGWQIERLFVEPSDAPAFPGVIKAIQEAELIIIGPGSLYTSILANLLLHDITQALRLSRATKVYVCNIATQPGETDGYSLADHVLAIEHHVGRGVFDLVIGNNCYPTENAGLNTVYVQPAPPNHNIHQRYRVIYADLTDDQYPWRHSPDKLHAVLTDIIQRK